MLQPTKYFEIFMEIIKWKTALILFGKRISKAKD